MVEVTVTMEVENDGVAVITMFNPPLNVITTRMFTTLIKEKFVEATMRNDVKAIVLAGNGGRFFAGFDINVIQKIQRTWDNTHFPDVSVDLVMNTIEDGKKPSVVAIEGLALGGALEFALGFHARIATPRAQVALTELSFGIVPGFGGTMVSTQILTEVSQCVETINGVKEGMWKATLSLYKPILKEKANALELPQEYLEISLQEQPDKCYLVIRGQRLIMEAESSMQVIMEKMQSYKTRVGLNFEGFQYQLGDFRLRVGKAVPIGSESLRGIVMEMEYLPISSLVTSQLIMGEFFDIWKEALEKKSLPGHFVHVEPKFSEYGLADQYTSQHTAVQYAETLAQMIAADQSSKQ